MKSKGINKKTNKKKNINLRQFNFLDDLDISLQENENKEEIDNGISKRSESEQQNIEPLGNSNLESLDDKSYSRDGRVDERRSNNSIGYNREASGQRKGNVATRYESSGDEQSNQHGFNFSNQEKWLESTNNGVNNETSKFIEQKVVFQTIGFDKELNKEKSKPIIQVTPSIQKEVFFLNEEDASFNFLSKKQKAKNSIEAIKLAKNLSNNQQNPSIEEQKTIAKYIGFGGVPQLFDEQNTEYQELQKELKSIVNAIEYQELRDSTSDSFYTNKVLIDGIYKAVDKLGYLNKKGLNILEPSCGSGNLMGYMPKHFRDNNKIVGIELNSISALISKALYEKDNISILNQAFQEINHNNDKFDVVIGNFPFGSQIIHDKFSSTASGKNLHNYFLTKSIESLSDKGILVVITSSQFLNQKNPNVKEAIDKQADFIGAIRLPKEAFKTADTEALCDIVIFQKNESKSIDYQYEENSWIKEDFVANFNVYNDDYFVARIGECSYEKDRFGKGFYNFSEPFENIQSKLNEIIENNLKDISKDFIKKDIQQDNNIKSYSLDNNIFIGEYLVTKSGEIEERIEDSIDGSRIQILDIKGNKQKYIDYIELKESTKELLRIEVENKEEKIIFEQRKLTNIQYDDFVLKHGNLNDKNNKSFIIEDVRGRLVLELEQLSTDGKIKRAGILDNRLIKNKTAEIKNTKDALYHSVATKGKIDLEYISNLKELNFKGNTDKVIKAIEGLNLAYYNPKFKQWELAEQYLSGNVLEKLEDLDTSKVDENINFKRNKSALEKVIPKRVSIAEIGIDLTASWIPLEYKKDFINSLLLSKESLERGSTCIDRFEYEEVTATYDIKINEWTTARVLNRSEYGTDNLPASEIITRMFKGRSIDVKERIDGSDNLRVNPVETELALNKAELIKEKFQEYVINNPSIANDLEDKYNRTFNNYVVPNYSNGEQLTLPNSNDAIVLRPHQKRAVLRGILEDRYLLDHVVGSGKTYTMCATIMERKRLGLNNKPMLISIIPLIH